MKYRFARAVVRFDSLHAAMGYERFLLSAVGPFDPRSQVGVCRDRDCVVYQGPGDYESLAKWLKSDAEEWCRLAGSDGRVESLTVRDPEKIGTTVRIWKRSA